MLNPEFTLTLAISRINMTKYNNEIVDIPEEEYFSIKAASNSVLKILKRSPAHCLEVLTNPMEPTASMQLGSLVHTLVLEPALFESRYHVQHEDDPKTPRSETITLIIAALHEEKFSEQFFVDEGDKPRAPKAESIVADIAKLMISGDSIEKYVSEPEALKLMKIPRKPANDSKTGEIAHLLIKGMDTGCYAAEPVFNKKTKEGKADFINFFTECEQNNKIVCKQEELDKAHEYANCMILKNNFASECNQKNLIVCSDDDMQRASTYAEYIIKIGERLVIKENDLMIAKNYAAFLRHIGDKEIITEEMLDTANAMAVSLIRHPIVNKLFKSGKAEQSMFWTDPDTGLYCKGRLDWASDLGYLVDLKTTIDASVEQFSRSIANFGYHRQNAMYVDGYTEITKTVTKGFIFIAVESKAPHAVGVYNLDSEGEGQGRMEYKELLAQFGECLESDVWPAYSDKVEEIELPHWYK